MTDLDPLTDGRDTHVNQSFPKSAPYQSQSVLLRGGSSAQSRALVHFGRLDQAVRGESVLKAVLSGGVIGSWATTTLKVELIRDGWAIAFQTWENQPAVRGTSVSASTGAKSNGQRFSVDVTSLVRQIAGGTADFGFRISSSVNGDRRVKSFDAPGESWRLDITVKDPVDAPVGLAPDVGVVGVAKPWLSWEAPDTGSRTAPQEALQVQVDPNMNGTSPSWSSGTVNSIEPELNLATTSYPGASNGVDTFWRSRTLSGGEWSEWSDWAEFTFWPYPAGEILSPAAGRLTDASPTVSGRIAAGSLVAWSVAILNETGTSQRYDSNRQPGQAASFQAAIPAKSGNGVAIFPSDGAYLLRVRMWDREDRVATPGDPGYVELSRVITLEAGANPRPTNLTATQIARTPQVRLTWDRGSTADKWTIRRNGVRIATLTAAQDPTADGEVDTTDPGSYAWVDRMAPMEQTLSYEVQAVEDDEGSAWSLVATVATALAGGWLIRSDGTMVELDNFDASSLGREDRRVTFSPPGVGYDVEIVTAFGGLAGDVSGTVDSLSSGGIERNLKQLEAIKDRPGEIVRLAYGDVNVPVLIADLDWNPDGERWSAGRRTQAVEFRCWQVAEFRSTV